MVTCAPFRPSTMVRRAVPLWIAHMGLGPAGMDCSGANPDFFTRTADTAIFRLSA